MSTGLIIALTAIAGAPYVLTEHEDLIPYGFDGTAALKQIPRAVVFPRTAAEIAEILTLAREHGMPVRDETCARAFLELACAMVVPVISMSRQSHTAMRLLNHFHLGDRVLPSQQAERPASAELNFLTERFHR